METIYTKYDRIDMFDAVKMAFEAGINPYDISFILMQVRDMLPNGAMLESDARLLDSTIARLERFDESDVRWFKKNGWMTR